jgi:hypothetical protein
MDFLIIFGEDFSKRLPLFIMVVTPAMFIGRFGVDYLVIANPEKFDWLRGNNKMGMREARSYEMHQAALGDFIPLVTARLKLGVITAVAASFLGSFIDSIQIVLDKIR